MLANPCAFARKDAFDHQPERQMFEGHNRWELTRQGVEEFERVLSCFRRGEGDVARGYLWTPAFKKLLDPRYASTTAYTKPPGTISRPKS